MIIDNLKEFQKQRHVRGNARVVHCHGCFDILHLGHLWHLEDAKRMGDILIVTVTGDEYIKKGKGRPIFDAEQRSRMLDSLKCIDYVAIVDAPTAARAIREIRPDTYVKGSDYREGIAEDELEALAAVRGNLAFTTSAKMSSTEIIRRCKEAA